MDHLPHPDLRPRDHRLMLCNMMFSPLHALGRIGDRSAHPTLVFYVCLGAGPRGLSFL